MASIIDMVLTPILRKQIENDIALCENHTERDGSEQLYSELVARYSVIDADFKNNLSTNGKAATIGMEFDFRPELKAIASKLKMYLMLGEEETQLSPEEMKINEFIQRGEHIGKVEYHPAEGGFAISYVSGPLYDAWMGEINIFNQRYLQKHPLYQSIHSTYFHSKNNPSSFKNMMGHLRALASDKEYFHTLQREDKATVRSRKTIDQLLSEDIERVELFLNNPTDEDSGRDLYIEITGRYDSIIKNFGSGLYQYYEDQHFYDPEISGESLLHNMRVLLNKMISYQAVNYPPVQRVEAKKEAKKMSNKVFIVHGHDNEAIQEMARTLEKADFEAIVLREQPDGGLTIIEKIEQYSDVDFAVVLYTQCDLGRAKGDPVEKEKYRARQNVVFEHGYLIGKLGRNHVCAVVKCDVETPGDISGVVYVPMDEHGAWKMRLARNMQDIGLPVDMNKFCR